MALHLKEHNSKFLTNRYGEVKHYYSPQVEIAVIEADIKRLLAEEFHEAKFEKLHNPPAEAFNWSHTNKVISRQSLILTGAEKIIKNLFI